MQAQTSYLDVWWGLGISSRELVVGIDCPLNAEYIDTSLYRNGELLEYRNAICVFEMDTTVPLRRHDDRVYNTYAGLRGHVLVVRAIAAVCTCPTLRYD
jgi:diamine oxidase